MKQTQLTLTGNSGQQKLLLGKRTFPQSEKASDAQVD